MFKTKSERQRLGWPLSIVGSQVYRNGASCIHMRNAGSRVGHSYIPGVVKFGHLTTTKGKVLNARPRTSQ